MDHKRELYLSRLDQLQGFFVRVESKATFLFAIDLTMLGVLAVNFPIKDPKSFPAMLAYLTASLICWSLGKIYAALFPHLDPAPRPSLLYFKDVSDLTEADFIKRLSLVSDADLLDDIASQIWRNSEILALKYHRMKQAFQIAATAMPVWLLYLVLVAAVAGKIPHLGAS